MCFQKLFIGFLLSVSSLSAYSASMTKVFCESDNGVVQSQFALRFDFESEKFFVDYQQQSQTAGSTSSVGGGVTQEGKPAGISGDQIDHLTCWQSPAQPLVFQCGITDNRRGVDGSLTYLEDAVTAHLVTTVKARKGTIDQVLVVSVSKEVETLLGKKPFFHEFLISSVPLDPKQAALAGQIKSECRGPLPFR